MVKAFRAVGTFRSGVKNQPFTIDVVADDEDGAMEYVYSCLLYTSPSPRD